jgi:glycosyltransferase involved in cell wall biosynthesis
MIKNQVSIILPTFNRAYCLDRTIQSVLNQTFINWELVIIDNHSTDFTEHLVSSYDDKRISFFKIHNDGIVAKSRNMGLSLAKGEFVAFLDSDDWWLPQKLEASIFQLRAGAQIVYHDLYLIKSNSPQPYSFRRVKTRQLNSPVFLDLLNNGPAITNSSVVINHSLMIQIGGFLEDPTIVGAEDYEAWLRVSKYTELFHRLDRTLGYYWQGGGNLTSSKRTLSYLKTLSNLYSVNNNSNGLKSGWFLYNLALTNFKLGKYKDGKKYGKVLLFYKPLSLYAFKLLIAWIFILLFNNFKDGENP